MSLEWNIENYNRSFGFLAMIFIPANLHRYVKARRNIRHNKTKQASIPIAAVAHSIKYHECKEIPIAMFMWMLFFVVCLEDKHKKYTRHIRQLKYISSLANNNSYTFEPWIIPTRLYVSSYVLYAIVGDTLCYTYIYELSQCFCYFRSMCMCFTHCDCNNI